MIEAESILAGAQDVLGLGIHRGRNCCHDERTGVWRGITMRRCGTRSTRTSATSSTNGLSRQGPFHSRVAEAAAAASIALNLGFVCCSDHGPPV